MKTNYLLPNKYKALGWTLLILGLIFGVFIVFSGYESDFLKIKVPAFFHDYVLGLEERSFFKMVENSIVDELAALAIIIGGLIVGFSKEKVEDEYIYKLRTDSLVWALIFNYAVLAVTIVFVYNLSFLNVMVFNMFTPLLFYIIRFNYLKSKA